MPTQLRVLIRFPLYDQLDDDTINQYRRNIPFFDSINPFNPSASPAPFRVNSPFDFVGSGRGITTADTIRVHMPFDEVSVAGSLGRVK